jgi:cell division protein FtsL
MSPIIFRTPSEVEYTPIGSKEYLSEGREVSIESWKYSKKQDLMEVMIDIENNAYDGKDFNNYTAYVNFQEASKGKEQLAVEIKLQQINFVVLWLHDVPEGFNCCVVTVYMKDKTETSASLYTNYSKVETVNNLSNKSETEYQIEKIERNISKLRKKIKENNSDISDLQKEIKIIKTHIKEEQDNKSYQTKREQQKTEEIIEDYRTQISDREFEIGELQKDNASHQSKITEYENLISRLRGKK